MQTCRAQLTPSGRGKRPASDAVPVDVSAHDEPRSPEQKRRAMSWAQRLKRVFSIDVTTCAHCGGAVRIVASIEEPTAIRAIRAILAHFEKHGALEQAHYRPAARAPPRSRFGAASIGKNIVRELMHLAPAGPSRILGVLAGAAVVALLLVVLGRIALMIIKAVMRLVTRKVPRRIAHVVGAIAGVLLLVGLVNGVILSSLLDTLDASYRQADALIPPDMPPPTEWDSPGSAQSLVAWNQLGRMGRRYVDARPTADELAAYAGPGAKAPLRVYAGLPTGDTPEERAQLALEELKRVGGFERKALIIITPTGTGWVDPSGIDGIEYLYRGDVASVAVQYSYLSSPLTLFLDPDTGGVTARALFREVYGYWRTLPPERRPKLYLHGLSLGALNSERSFEMFELLGEPFDGAVWSGTSVRRQQVGRADPLAQSRFAGVAAAVPGRLVRPLHEPGRQLHPARHAVGPDARGLPAVRQRRGDVLRPSRLLPRTGTARCPAPAGRIPGDALVSGRDDDADGNGYFAVDERTNGFRPRLRAIALHQRLAGSHRHRRLVARRRGPPAAPPG